MTLDFEENQAPYRIADVERDTGIAKETLRVWERRYGFPRPDRDEQGDRLYPIDQVERLRLVKRLQDQGGRPGTLLKIDLATMKERLDCLVNKTVDPVVHKRCAEIIKLLRMHRDEDLRQVLNQTLVKEGLYQFITLVVAPLNVAVGDAWLRGELTISEEHLYTEVIQNVLRHTIQTQTRSLDPPKILLATFPDEVHILGILMVEALCIAEGANCVSLGASVPVADILEFAVAGKYDVVALSFSSAYAVREAVRQVNEFRKRLPGNVQIWAGGGALLNKKNVLEGVFVANSVEAITGLISDWRAGAVAEGR